MTPEAAVEAVLRALDPGGPVVVAVSGGGDSTALLHVTARGDRRGRPLLALTVDHGLRPGSAEEARGVARACEALGVPHETLPWDGAGAEGRGRNLQQRAREARRRLIGARARALGGAAVLLGHTADDQAETVLLRLARGSGVDGLAGMPGGFAAEGVRWERPFLSLTRDSLRLWLREQGLVWTEDPSNRDPRFDRARARAMMGALADLGLTRERLVRTAGHMRAARAVLAAAAAERAREAEAEGRDLLLPAALVREAGSRTAEGRDGAGRVLAAALMWVGGRDRRPRHEALLRLAAVVAGGRAATLAGCRVSPEGGERVRVAPEARRTGSPEAPGTGSPEAARTAHPAGLAFDAFVRNGG